MGSTRLPGKVLKKIGGKTLFQIMVERLSLSKKVNQIILATSQKTENAPLVQEAARLGVKCFSGSENNVLSRYYEAAKLADAELIVRITGDCPLVDAKIVDQVIELVENKKCDYASNVMPPTFPDGLDVEAFSFKCLERTYNEAESKYDKEHVTTYMRKKIEFSRENLLNPEDLSNERWTVDEPEDLELIKAIFNYFLPRIDFSWTEVLNLKEKEKELFKINTRYKRNEGALMDTSQKLWARAKKVIPGGNSLLSKRPEMFLPNHWPSYFNKAKGCKVWGIDGVEYLDMSIMGVGTNILGYAHPEVDDVVVKAIKDGNMSTLNCAEEVYLAEKLVELHPWADMVRFARTGGEANSMAIRIARASSGKDKIAFCGYHGWHDWYLSANLADNKQLDGHLLPGLSPNGVPRGLKGTTIPFNYNDIEHLEQIMQKGDVGTIKMEVARNAKANKPFLEKVREVATKYNAVLIFDECTSGFREALGGLHMKYGVEPDMAIFGKALGNGYAITAVAGRRDFMQHAQSSFISSTFWTERVGPVAALKTLEIMERISSWETITNTGHLIREKWEKLGEKYDLKIKVTGLPALSVFQIESDNWLKYKTYITQELLKENVLASNAIYVSTEHKDKELDIYFDLFEKVLSRIAECELGQLDINELLEWPVCHAGFKRLN